MSDYHLSFSIGRSLWNDLVGSALPLPVADGAFDLGKTVYKGVKQLDVRNKFAALIDERDSPNAVKRAKERLADVWRRHKGDVYRVLNELIHVDGKWAVALDKDGTDFHYGEQKIGVDAHVKAMASGRITLMRENLEIPFKLEKRLGASCHLGDIHFDADRNAVVGSITDPSIDLGEHVILKALNDGVAKLLSQQTQKLDAIPLIKKDQLEEMVSPAGGPLKLQLGIEDVRIDVTEDDLSLKVKFGFQNKQLTGE